MILEFTEMTNRKGENKMIINGIEMDSLAMEYKSIQNQIDKLSEELESIKNKIKEKLSETEDYRTETFHFVYKTVVASRFDSAAFKKDNPVLAAQYTKQSQSRPLKIN